MGAPTSTRRRLVAQETNREADRQVAGTPGDPDHLGRSITLFQLIMFGVGATIGPVSSSGSAETVPVAGPAVIVSFAIAGSSRV